MSLPRRVSRNRLFLAGRLLVRGKWAQPVSWGWRALLGWRQKRSFTVLGVCRAPERKDTAMSLKDTIAAIRKEAGITQEEMARRLYVTRQAVSRWGTERVKTV